MTSADQMIAENRAYTEAFSRGIRCAASNLTRDQAKALAYAMPVREGDGFLAGYYAELRKRRFDADMDAVDMERGYCVWTKP